jgi:hypothetical protein
LIDLAKHAYRLYELLAEDDLAYAIDRASQAADWLILAAGLKEVVIHTAGLEDQDLYCANTYEEDRGRAVSTVAAELTRFLFIWGAVEELMKSALRGTRRDESKPKQMSRLSDSSNPPLLHHNCAAQNLLSILNRHPDPEFTRTVQRAMKFDSGTIGQATFAAYGVRNALVHGAVPWPDDHAAPAKPLVVIGRLASRVLLFAVQCMLLRLTPSDATTMDWPGDLDEPRMRLARQIMHTVHLDLSTGQRA